MWPPHISRHLATTWAAGMECDTVSPMCTHSFCSHWVSSWVMFTMGSSSHSRSGKTRSHASMWKEVSIGYWPMM